jgi:hypothetical protein
MGSLLKNIAVRHSPVVVLVALSGSTLSFWFLYFHILAAVHGRSSVGQTIQASARLWQISI